MCRLSVVIPQPGCMINPEEEGGVHTVEGRGQRIFIFFQGSPHAECNRELGPECAAKNLPMKQVLLPGWLCCAVSGQLAVVPFELEAWKKPEIGAAIHPSITHPSWLLISWPCFLTVTA